VLRIDTTGPTTLGKSVTAFTGHAVKLRYEVLDALSPQVGAVELVLTDGRGKVVQRVALGARNANTWYSAPWTPNATGTYHYTVSAHDLAGNAQRKATPAKVVVKGPWWYTIGHSVQHRAIVVARFGTGARRLLVVGGVHGDEYGTAVAKRFAAYLAAHPGAVPAGARIDVIRCANPDGYLHHTRGNARHVDLNRNLPTANWTRLLSAGDEPGNPGLTGGSSPGSEPETKALLTYLRTGFATVVSLHSHAGILDCDGPGARALGLRMSKLCGLPVGRLSYDPYITGSLGEYVPARYHVPVVTVELRSTAMSGGLRAALLAAAKS
jgi:predicted deacylase